MEVHLHEIRTQTICEQSKYNKKTRFNASFFDSHTISRILFIQPFTQDRYHYQPHATLFLIQIEQRSAVLHRSKGFAVAFSCHHEIHLTFAEAVLEPLPFGSGVTVRTSGYYPDRNYLLLAVLRERSLIPTKPVFGLSSPCIAPERATQSVVVWYSWIQLYHF